MTVKRRRPAFARLPQSVVSLFLRTQKGGLFLLSAISCLSLCGAAPVRLQPNSTPVTSPLLLLERSIGQVSEQPEFLSLLSNALTAKPSSSTGSALPSLSSSLGSYEEENSQEVWEQRVRPPHHVSTPKPKDQHQHEEHQQQQQLLQGNPAFDVHGIDAVSQAAASSHPPSTQQMPAAAAADAAQVRQPGEVGGRYPLDSGHPPTGSATQPQHRLLKPMRTIAYGNIHQTAYYFAGDPSAHVVTAAAVAAAAAAASDLFVGAGAPQRQSLILDTGSSVMAFPFIAVAALAAAAAAAAAAAGAAGLR
ncbi:hypothetical protein Emag_001008 [Eimeria magna]